MAEIEPSAGKDLSLSFANALGGMSCEVPQEAPNQYAALLAWGREAGILTPSQADTLQRTANRQPRQTLGVLFRVQGLRDAIYRLFTAPPEPEDLSRLNAELARGLPHLRVEAGAPGFAWSWEAAPEALDSPLWPVARAAAELLVSDLLVRVRKCANPTCTYLFIDSTKNHSRRWCDMGSCGNLAKVRKHREKQRGGR